MIAGHRSSYIRFDDLDFKKEPYNKWVSYGQSKTANIYLANEIERRYGSQGGLLSMQRTCLLIVILAL